MRLPFLLLAVMLSLIPLAFSRASYHSQQIDQNFPEQRPERTTEEFETTTEELETTTEELKTTTEEPETTTEDFSTTINPDLCNHDCEYRGIDCHTYYTCINFTYKEYHTCPEKDGLAFNPLLKVCDLVDNVDRCRPFPTSPPPEKCICQYRPHESDCGKYYYCPDTCQENLCQIRSCPFGLLWSIDAYSDGTGHQQCTLPQKTTCALADPTVAFSCSQKPDGLYLNSRNCRSFWKCTDGKPLLYNCPTGMIYNPQIERCDVFAKANMFCRNSNI